MCINDSNGAFVICHPTQQSSLPDFRPRLFSCLPMFPGEILHKMETLFFASWGRLLTNSVLLSFRRGGFGRHLQSLSFHCGKILRRSSSIFFMMFSPSLSLRLESLKFQQRLYLSTLSILSFSSVFSFLRFFFHRFHLGLTFGDFH